ncbi:hypothetical protein ACF0H5_018050 [Mactra antiquata]
MLSISPRRRALGRRREIGMKSGVIISDDEDSSSVSTGKYLDTISDRRSDTSELSMDRFNTLSDISKDIERLGIDSVGLIFGIDYTISNRVQGQKTFSGRSLHDLTTPYSNPYQEVICIMGETLEPLDDDGMIPTYGFGDRVVKDRGIFPLKKEGDCEGFCEVLDVYNRETPKIKLGGPTNFAPLIHEAIKVVQHKKQYHILVIVADGQVTSEEDTIEAIIQASQYPLSIIMIGVGDGPWDIMEDFDNKLSQRVFDNFQFVDFHKTKEANKRFPHAAVARAALSAIPEQFKAIQKLQLLTRL